MNKSNTGSAYSQHADIAPFTAKYRARARRHRIYSKVLIYGVAIVVMLAAAITLYVTWNV